MLRRTITAGVGLPVLLGIVWVGGYWFTAFAALIAGLGAWELCRMASAWGQRPVMLAAVAAAALLAASGQVAAGLDAGMVLLIAVAGGGAAAACLLPMAHRLGGRRGSALATVCIAALIGGTLFHGVVIRHSHDGLKWLLFALIVTFATDTGAYLLGRAIGSRKLAPSISPRKTWEGAAGGLGAAVFAGAMFGWVQSLGAPDAMGGVYWRAEGALSSWVQYPFPSASQLMAAAAILAVTGQLGDLYVSKLKRLAGFGDSGSVFPGHGGALDRMDSIMFNVVALIYVCLAALGALFRLSV